MKKLVICFLLAQLTCCCSNNHNKSDGGTDSGDDSGTDSGTEVSPRLLSPLSTSAVSSLGPTFYWEGEEDVGYTVEISDDREFANIVQTWSGVGLEYTPNTDLEKKNYYWRVCVDDSNSLCSETWEVFAGTVPHDFNNDGYSDILVGTLGITDTNYIYFGSADPSDTYDNFDADVVITGANAHSNAAYGDITGDGIADVVLGIQDYPPNGVVFVCEGRENWPEEISLEDCSSIVHEGDGSNIGFGDSPSTSQDLDMDGTFDLMASHASNTDMADYSGTAFLFLSGNSPIIDRTNTNEADTVVSGTNNWHGFSGDKFLHDMNGDGYPEALFTASRGPVVGPEWVGETYLLLGQDEVEPAVSSDELDFIATTPEEDTGFWAGDSIGDADGDGYGDAIIGYLDRIDDQELWIMLIGGRASMPESVGFNDGSFITRILHPSTTNTPRIVGMLGTGDLNGDGLSDFAFTHFGNGVVADDPLGAIYIFYGAADLQQEMNYQDADVTITGNGDPSFGNAWGSLGDVNGDGYSDFAVSATGDGPSNSYDEFPGRVFVFFGGPGLEEKETANDADMVLSSTTPNEMFGICINEARGF